MEGLGRDRAAVRLGWFMSIAVLFLSFSLAFAPRSRSVHGKREIVAFGCDIDVPTFSMGLDLGGNLNYETSHNYTWADANTTD